MKEASPSMGTILVTTTHRHCRLGEPSGFVYTIDAQRWRLSGSCPIVEPPYLEADPNPRGGMRGAKGIAVVGDTVFLANASVVYRFDASWNVLGTISHPSCAYIHDIVWHENSLWVASCCNDLVLRFNLNGRVLQVCNVRSYAEVRQALNWHVPERFSTADILAGAIDFRDPRTHRSEEHDGAHINSLCFLPNGDLLVLLGLVWTRRWAAQLTLKSYLQRWGLWRPFAAGVRPLLRLLPLPQVSRGDLGKALTTGSAALLRVRPSGPPQMVWVLPNTRMPTHSLLPRSDGTVLLNDTSSGCIIHLDPERGAVLARIKVTDEFLRGIFPVGDHRVLVGSQRDVLLVDLEQQRVLNRLRLSENSNVSVYDIKMLPPGFTPLPKQFPETKRYGALVCT
jgi:hypothetical protein